MGGLTRPVCTDEVVESWTELKAHRSQVAKIRNINLLEVDDALRLRLKAHWHYDVD